MATGVCSSLCWMYSCSHDIKGSSQDIRIANGVHVCKQVREKLYAPYFHQWLQDTQELLERLPHGLEAPEQSLALTLTFERWLLLLKVCQPLPRILSDVHC